MATALTNNKNKQTIQTTAEEIVRESIETALNENNNQPKQLYILISIVISYLNQLQVTRSLVELECTYLHIIFYLIIFNNKLY